MARKAGVRASPGLSPSARPPMSIARSVSPPFWFMGEDGLEGEPSFSRMASVSAPVPQPALTLVQNEELETAHKTGVIASSGLSPVHMKKLQALNDEASQIRPRRTKEDTLADAAVVFADVMTSAGIDLSLYSGLRAIIETRDVVPDRAQMRRIWSRGRQPVAVQEIFKDSHRNGEVRIILECKATLTIYMLTGLVLGEVGAFMGPCVRLHVSSHLFSVSNTSRSF
jgi:hypothetical protein